MGQFERRIRVAASGLFRVRPIAEVRSMADCKKPPLLPCMSTPLNLVATSGPARLFSTSIEGLSAATSAWGPLIVQFKVRVLRQ